MRPFLSQDGRQIIPVPHEAKFNGKNNSCKSKVLIILYRMENSYLTAKQVHRYTGVSYEYLLARLTFWYNIRYVNRRPTKPAKGRPVWQYQIAERGKHFVDNRIPAAIKARYYQEIHDWQQQANQSQNGAKNTRLAVS